ncbi:hypothetical protein GCM10020295_37060 [Streptomyces cinereospinus]
MSRMHGVILAHLPIGTGPATPSDMIDRLPHPLRDWVPLGWDQLPEDMGNLIVLEDDNELTEQAFEAGMSYLEALYRDDGRFDHGGTWLPAWVRQTAEQTERSTFRQIRSGSQADYEAARTMLTEVPCGTEQALIEEYSRRRAARMDVYEVIPPRTASSKAAMPLGGGRVRSAPIPWCCAAGSCDVSIRRTRADSGFFRTAAVAESLRASPAQASG